MRHLITSSFFILGLIFSALSQSNKPSNLAESAPIFHNTPFSHSKANWDLDFSADVSTSTGSLSQAGVTFFNNEFWTSQWSSDTLFRYTSSGAFIQKFTVAGVSGTRAITTDGSFLYCANASNTIYVVDPSLQSVVNTITSGANVSSRFLTYDPTLDGGAGGFWTGNFNTDIESISMTGALLSTIPAATHLLSGMYGAAIDNVSFGGPYLWVFHQDGNNNSTFSAIEIPSGAPTTNSFDAFPDASGIYGLTSSLAGGAFLTTDLIPGETTLIGLLQGTPSNVIVGYELDLVPVFDVGVSSNRPTNGYTQIPNSQTFAENFEVTYNNYSTSSIDSVFVDINFYHDGSLIMSDTQYDTSVAVGGSNTFSFNFNPTQGTGIYQAIAVSRTDVSFIDSNPLNDTLSYTFHVTDSIYARDNNFASGISYSVSPTDSAIIASIYEITTTDTVTGIWIHLDSPVQDDTTYGIIYNYDGTSPTSIVAIGDKVIIDALQNEYYLEFNQEVILTPGKYAFGCYEGVTSEIHLSQSDIMHTPNTNYIFTSNTWTADTNETALFIRPILGTYSAQNASIIENELSEVTISPNPANDYFTVDFGEVFHRKMVLYPFTMGTGKLIKKQSVSSTNGATIFRIGNLTRGVYRIIINTESSSVSRSLFIR